MDKIIVKQVGSKENPLKIYWNFEGKKRDEALMIVSISSGSYGLEYLDVEEFERQSKYFFRYSKCDKKYFAQLKYVLENSNPDCSDTLIKLIEQKWNISFEYNNIYKHGGEA